MRVLRHLPVVSTLRNDTYTHYQFFYRQRFNLEIAVIVRKLVAHPWCCGWLSRLPGERPRDRFPPAPKRFMTYMAPSEERYCV